MLITFKTKISADAVKYSAVNLKALAKNEHLHKLNNAVMSYVQHKENEIPTGIEVESRIVALTPSTLGEVLELLSELRKTEPRVAAAVELLLNQ